MHILNSLASIGLSVLLLCTFVAGFKTGRWTR